MPRYIIVIILFSSLTLILILSSYLLQKSPKLEQSDNPTPQVSIIPSNNLIPNFDHIIVMVFENKDQSEILSNPDATFFQSIADQNSLAANYTAVTHPSLPNYISMLSGSTFGISSDCTDCFISSTNLAQEITNSHRSWKAYMESMPEPCFAGSTNLYAQKHNPFYYFDDIRQNKTQCGNIVPLTNLATDLNSNQAPNFIYITPNLCNDMHDCPIKTGNQWASQEVTKILSSPIFQKQNSLLIITFDEGSIVSNNLVTTILVGSNVKKHFISNIKYNHYSLLKTIEAAWNLAPMNTEDRTAIPMSDFFLK